MKRHIIFGFCIIVAAALSVAGQTPSNSAPQSGCNLTLAQSPEIRGIRLGMSPEALMNLFPEETYRLAVRRAVEESKQADNYGSGRFNLQPQINVPDSRFTNVYRISIGLLDERVVNFTVEYTSPLWDDVDQFIARLSEAFGLPSAEAWRAAEGEGRKTLICNDFEVQVSVSTARQNWVRVRNPSTTNIVQARAQAARENERRAFRP